MSYILISGQVNRRPGERSVGVMFYRDSKPFVKFLTASSGGPVDLELKALRYALARVDPAPVLFIATANTFLYRRMKKPSEHLAERLALHEKVKPYPVHLKSAPKSYLDLREATMKKVNLTQSDIEDMKRESKEKRVSRACE